ncbi:hypothetical protein KR009_006201 [Drosophila setifemur]|nr:hypothetical protein KR009_006201 [Drosophila setifemur]
MEAITSSESEYSGNYLSCLLCDKTFCTPEKLQEHLTNHFSLPETKTYFCDLCGRGLRSPQELHQHFKRFHEAHLKELCPGSGAGAVDQFECSHCAKIFILEEYLKVHVKLDHCSEGLQLDKKSLKREQRVEQLPDYSLDPIFCPPPKRKYPPRSPFFNP